MNTNSSIPENRLAAFCKANGITRLALFGSVLRDDFGPDRLGSEGRRAGYFSPLSIMGRPAATK